MTILRVTRREFVVALGSAAAWPMVARGQDTPVIGLLGSESPEFDAYRVSAFRQGLGETGYVEGRNVVFEYHWAEHHFDRLPALATRLLDSRVSVIVGIGTTPAALAAKAATKTIPVVFAIGGDPIKLGLVESLNRPGGNITGVSFLVSLMAAKRLEVLHGIVPGAAPIGFLVNPKSPIAEADTRDAIQAAETIGSKVIVAAVNAEGDMDGAIATLVQQHVGGFSIAPDQLFFDHRDQLVTLAARNALPAIYPLREFVDAGGLVSYGTSIREAFRHVGIYVGRILNGEKPGDLPVQQAVKVELIINLKTTKALGLNIPLSLLGRADEVIE
jgi:putative tryptophan/tyrosine transport system substrate-binding protein